VDELLGKTEKKSTGARQKAEPEDSAADGTD
jgi:hypothetical protein